MISKCPKMAYSPHLPHSRESGNPDKYLILLVLLDSRFRGNEATRDLLDFLGQTGSPE